jgi:hypothetical protein
MSVAMPRGNGNVVALSQRNSKRNFDALRKPDVPEQDRVCLLEHAAANSGNRNREAPGPRMQREPELFLAETSKQERAEGTETLAPDPHRRKERQRRGGFFIRELREFGGLD